MADDRSARALAAAERLFKRRPDAPTEDFRAVCERADPTAIAPLTNREFNGSYVLPFRRKAALRRKAKTTKKKAKRRAKPGPKPKNGRRTRKKKTTRKKKKKKTTRKKRGRPARQAGLSAERRIAQLIRERDAKLLDAAGDAMKVYHIASKIDEFAADLVDEANR